MIISYKHRYVFLHCRKTAGSSIGVSLSRSLGPNDLLLSGLRETLAAGMPVPAQTRNEAIDENRKNWRLGQSLALYGLKGKDARNQATRKRIMDRYRTAWGEPTPQHAYAESLANAFPQEWAEFRKFCVVRNPWTKAVSDYFWRIKTCSTPPSFSEFISAIEQGNDLGGIVPLRYHDNWPLYTIDNQIVADDVIRFEDLVPQLTQVCTKLGIPFDGWLPKAKGNHRPKSGAKADPFSFYTPALRDTVGLLYEKEISAFNYTFG